MSILRAKRCAPGSRPISPGRPQPELCAIHLVRNTGDFTAAMPRFVTAFLEAQFRDDQ